MLDKLKEDNKRLNRERDEWKSQYDESKPRLYSSYNYDSDGKMTCEGLADKLAELIESAKDEICIAVYDFNNSAISDALDQKAQEWKGQKKAIKIRIILDSKVLPRAYEMVKEWTKNGILVSTFNYASWEEKALSEGDRAFLRRQKRNAIIHYKEAIIDNLLWTGSKNFTRAGNIFNQEHVIITRDFDVVKSAYDNFNVLWKYYSTEII